MKRKMTTLMVAAAMILGFSCFALATNAKAKISRAQAANIIQMQFDPTVLTY